MDVDSNMATSQATKEGSYYAQNPGKVLFWLGKQNKR